MSPADPPDAAPVSKPGKRYRKLPGRMPTIRVGAYGRRSLYLGERDLVQVELTFFEESYKRFAYMDIQSLLLRQTSRGLIWSIVLAVWAAGFGLLAWGMSDHDSLVFCAVCAGIFVLLLLFNLARGATCQCHLQTATGPQPLLTLSRMRPARKALALLRERIVAAQGELAPADASVRVDEMLARPGTGSAGSPPRDKPPESYRH